MKEIIFVLFIGTNIGCASRPPSTAASPPVTRDGVCGSCKIARTDDNFDARFQCALNEARSEQGLPPISTATASR